MFDAIKIGSNIMKNTKAVIVNGFVDEWSGTLRFGREFGGKIQQRVHLSHVPLNVYSNTFVYNSCTMKILRAVLITVP